MSRRGKHSDLERAVGEDSGTKFNVLKLDVINQRPVSEARRYGLLTLATFAMICASTSYAFNLFSGSLRDKYNFDSRQMSTINTVGMVFAYFLLPYGTIYDYLGPLPVYVIGCVLASLGLLLMGLTFQGVIAGSVVRFCVFNALLSLGSQLFDLATVVTMLSIFPTRRGWVVALLKTMMGLGSAIIGSMRTGFFLDTPANYFYFLVGMVLVTGLCCIAVMRLPSYHLTGYQQSHLGDEERSARGARVAAYLTQEPPMWRFYLSIAVVLVLVVYLPTTSSLAAFTSVSKTQHTLLAFAIVTVIMTSCFLLMLAPCPWLDRLTTAKPRDDELDQDVEVLTDIDYIAPQYQTTFLQSCCTASLWCILWTMFCGVGAEFVIIFNASPIFSALTETPKLDTTVSALLTVLNGTGSALGRLVMSAFEGYTQKRKAEDRMPITIAFFVPTTLIILSMVLFLVLPGRWLLVAFAVASLGNGFCASVTILVLRTIYAKDPAKHYNFGYNALWISAILLNRLLYGEWIAAQADKQGRKVCLGRKCVLMPLLVMIGMNVTALLSDVYLHVRYCRFSRRVLAERRSLREGVAAAGSSEPIYQEKEVVDGKRIDTQDSRNSLDDSLDTHKQRTRCD
ncbi:major facilitator superfamily, putative [Leishmania tarentolae]|uniref:Major facilitator superfamily, putative n=1 Tax=Leishmania tarentolae TaxID=5689 RepID=A0A640KGQ7_LEITA|nr:major facilitator superfamily, putative [Leishmania tarentolae]